MSENNEQTIEQTTEPTKETKQRRQRASGKWRCALIDIEEPIPEFENMAVIREGENSGLVEFADRIDMEKFIAEYCGEPDADESDEVEFKVDSGGFLIPTFGRPMKIKVTVQKRLL